MADQADTNPLNDDDYENDSAHGEDDYSEDESLSPQASDFLNENRRTYHSYDHETHLYPYPNDEKEQDRLDLQHAMFNLLHADRLCLAPVQRPLSILDLGTGTGIWAIAMADAHPQARVLGVDLSPIQPISVPHNCTFNVFNYERRWHFKRSFDYIHARTPVGSIKDLDTLLAQAFKYLDPGGFIEFSTLCPPTSEDDTIPPNGSFQMWIDSYCGALQDAGYDPYLPEKYEQKLANAHFVGIEVVTEKIPQHMWPKSTWMKLLGKWNAVNIGKGLEGFSLRPFLANGDWNWTQLQVLLADVRKDIKNENIHAYWPLYTVYAQKPLSASIREDD